MQVLKCWPHPVSEKLRIIAWFDGCSLLDGCQKENRYSKQINIDLNDNKMVPVGMEKMGKKSACFAKNWIQKRSTTH